MNIIMPTTAGFKNRIGEKHTRLTVIAYAGKRGKTQLWSCLCDCGKNTVASGSNLQQRLHRSCGCLTKEAMKSRKSVAKNNHPAEYAVWKSMKSRCLNSKERDYAQYGARGITVCQRWADSFSDFVKDMGPRPSPEYSIDRFPDNNGNYEPGNCRWATAKEQGRNKRNNRLLEIDGQTLSLSEWAEKVGMTRSTLKYRINVQKMSPQEAISTPIDTRRKSGRFRR